jgi:ABC-type transport system involved in multi-copper enzyme maturation permease subunit
VSAAILSKKFRFHAAWLLLLLPPVAGVVVGYALWLTDWRPDFQVGGDSAGWVAFTVESVVALAALVFLHRIGRPGAPAKAAWLAKELRGLMPMALLAIVGSSIFSYLNRDDLIGGFGQALEFFCYVAGCCTAATHVTAFEFELRTVEILGAQPVDRASVYAVKLRALALVLGVATVTRAAVFWAFSGPSADPHAATFAALTLCPPVFAFATGPVLGQLTRHTLAAAVFVVAIPAAMWALVSFALALILRTTDFDQMTSAAQSAALGAWWALMALASVALFALGRRRYACMEVTGNPAARGGWRDPLSIVLDYAIRKVLPKGAAQSAFRKELRVQSIARIPFLLLAAFWIVWTMVRHLRGPEVMVGSGVGSFDLDGVLTVFVGAIVCLLAGGAAVSEERQWGVLDTQLASPVGVRKLWLWKTTVAGGTALLCGCVLPVVYLFAAYPQEMAADGAQRSIFVFTTLGVVLWAASMYGSAAAGDVVKAVCVALSVAAVGILTMYGVLFLGTFLNDHLTNLADAEVDHFKELIRTNLGNPAELARLRDGWAASSSPPSWLQWPAAGNIGAGIAFVSALACSAALIIFAARRFRGGVPGPKGIFRDGVRWIVTVAACSALFTAWMGAVFGASLKVGMAQFSTWTPEPPVKSRPATPGRFYRGPIITNSAPP